MVLSLVMVYQSLNLYYFYPSLILTYYSHLPEQANCTLVKLMSHQTQWGMLHEKNHFLNVSAFLLWPSQRYLTSHCREVHKLLFCDNIRKKRREKEKRGKRRKKCTICFFFLNFLLPRNTQEIILRQLCESKIIPRMFFTLHM